MNTYAYITALNVALIASSNNRRMRMKNLIQKMNNNKDDGGYSLMENELFLNLMGKDVQIYYFDGCSETGEVIQVNGNWIKLKTKKEKEILVNADCVKSIKVK